MWKNILCIYPYQKKRGIVYDDLHPPLGIEHIAASIKHMASEISIIDMRYEKKSIYEFLHGVDVVGVSIMWPHQKEIALELINQIPAGILVIAGGIDVTQNVEEYFRLSPRLDIVVRGEGELTVQDIFSGKPLGEIKGISYRNGGTIVHNNARPVADVSDIYPDRALRRYRYEYKMPLALNIGLDCIMSSRGCFYNCEFCTFNLDSSGRRRPWAGRTAKSIVDEIETIRSDVILFSDDNFGQDVDRVAEICNLIMTRKIKKVFGCEMRIEIARRPDVLKKMHKAGFRIIAFGIESSQDKTLRRMRKGFNVQQIKNSFEVLRQFNIFYLGYFIIGYFDETLKEILGISKFAQDLGLDFLGPTCLRALKYSMIRDIAEKTPEYYISKEETILSNRYTKDKLESIKQIVLRKFYSPSQIFKIIKKFLWSGMPKFLSLKIIAALFLWHFAGKKLNKPVGNLI